MALMDLWKRIVSPFRGRSGGLRQGILSAEAFQAVVEVERIRCDRNHGTCALVFFHTGNELPEGDRCDPLLKVLLSRMRCVDAVGWLCGGGLGVLLADTTHEGAGSFAEDVCRRLADGGFSRPGYALRTFSSQEIPREHEGAAAEEAEEEDLKKQAITAARRD